MSCPKCESKNVQVIEPSSCEHDSMDNAEDTPSDMRHYHCDDCGEAWDAKFTKDSLEDDV